MPSDPEYRKSNLTRTKERYANDPEHHKRELTTKQQRYANDPEYRERARANSTKWNNTAGNAMKALQWLYQTSIPAIADV